MRSGRFRISCRFRKEVLQNIACRLALDGIGGDQHRHAAETVRAHLRADEGRNYGDAVERRRSLDDVLKDELPGLSSGRILVGATEHGAEIYVDAGFVVPDIRHSHREIVPCSAGDADRRCEGGAQIRDGKLQGFAWAGLAEEIEAVAVTLGLEDAG